MHPAISVSAICTNRWDMERDLRFWADAGITNVGIALRKLEAAGLEEGSALIAEAELRVTNLLGLGFDLSDRERWPQHQDRLIAAVGAGVIMGAESFVLTTGAAHELTWEEAAGALGEAIAPVVEVADKADIPFLIEHTNSLRVDVGFVHTLRDAVDLARTLGVGVLMECNACWAERGLEASIIRAVADGLIGLVQVSDFVIGTLQTPDRAVPGDGDIPLGRLIDQMLRAGYDGVFDIEIIGPRIEEEGYPSAVGRSVEALTKLLPSPLA